MIARDSEVRPTVEQCQIALNFAYHAYETQADVGKNRRKTIAAVAENLGITIDRDNTIFGAPETYEALKGIVALYTELVILDGGRQA